MRLLSRIFMIPKEHLCSLDKTAMECGARNVTLMHSSSIVVENRTVLKCMFGCDGYGSRVCPPYIPSVDEFKKMLADYEWALLVEWDSKLHVPPDISNNFIRYGNCPPDDIETQKKLGAVVKQILWERKEIIQPGSLEIEKRAWSLGYYTALATFPGKCAWCATEAYDGVDCTCDMAPCRYPTLRRPCLMGLGIRLDKTLDALGISLPPFPLDGQDPHAFTIILLD